MTSHANKSRRSRKHRTRSFVGEAASIISPSESGVKTALTVFEEQILLRYVKSADDECRRFHKAANWNRKMRNSSNLLLLTLLYLTSGGSILYDFTTLSVDDPSFWPRLIINVLSILAAVTRTFQQVGNYEGKSINYETIGTNYCNYAREWRQKLAQGIDDRRDKCVEALVLAENGLSEIEHQALPL